MKSLDPLKKAKELLLIGEINLKLSQSFELDNEESSESKSTSTARTNNRRTAASVMSFSFAFMPLEGYKNSSNREHRCQPNKAIVRWPHA